MVEDKKIAFTGLDIPRLSLYAVISLILVLLWNVFTALLITATSIYMVYRFTRLAIGGFSCGHCYAKFFLSFAIFVFSLGSMSGVSVVVPLIALWSDALMKGVSK